MYTKRSIIIVTICNFICLLLLGCGNSLPPLEFSPSPDIIEKAIRIQLDQKYEQISEQLNTDKAEFKITKINVSQIKPTIQLKLPTYHLEGNYQLIFQKGKSKRKKIINNFQIDLQPQSAGQTWRIIIPYNCHQTIKYHSYKIS